MTEMTAGMQPLVLRPHPFAFDHGTYAVREGQTLQQMLEEAAQGAELRTTLRVEIGGREVPAALWSKVRPKAGVPIHVTGMPAGGGSGRKWIRTILLVVVMVAAMWITGGGAASAWGWGSAWAAGGAAATVAGAAISIIGALRVPALGGVSA